MSRVDRACQWLLMLLVPLLLVIGSIRLAMTPAWLHWEYTRPDFPPDPYGLTTADRLQYGGYGITYLLNDADIRFLADLRLPIARCAYPGAGTTCPMFSPEALRHMEDVKAVTTWAYRVGLAGGLLALGIGAYLWWGRRVCLWRGLLSGSVLTIGLIATIVLSSIVAWDVFFDTFHALFFADGTWQFYYSDTLIRLYPEQFWFDSALLIGGLTTLGALLMGGSVLFLNRPSRTTA